MSSDNNVHPVNNNRYETQKLYLTLLPYSVYDNPLKKYSRKLKLTRINPLAGASASASVGAPPSEFMIMSPYWMNQTTANAATSSSTASVIRTSAASAASGVKIRKKMKITSDSIQGETDPESPKPNNTVIDEETATNIIIFKPGEHEKMKHVKYSLADLRMLCSHYGIKKSGTKPELTQRIYTFLKQTYYVLRLQRIFRWFISNKYRTICGPGYLHASKCVNDTDFYTFDKLSKIRPMELFTYLDSDDKIYGFHIASIFHLIISSYPNITNPYNRSVIPSRVIKNVYEKLIYGSFLGFRVSVKLDDNNGVDDDDDGVGGVGVGGGGGVGGVGGVGGGHMNSAIGVNILTREKQEELFIVDLFQHINTLGNYSDSEWFIALQRVELIRFIRNIHDIWYYRANLTQEMKERICPPNGNPFVLHNAQVNLNVLTLLTDPEIRTICVSIIDRIVRRGITREDQCLGAFYVLATLTIVNQDARNAMPWLYEAVL
jgi:hypothetical protein